MGALLRPRGPAFLPASRQCSGNNDEPWSLRRNLTLSSDSDYNLALALRPQLVFRS